MQTKEQSVFNGSFTFNYTKDGQQQESTIDFVKDDAMYHDDPYLHMHLAEYFDIDKGTNITYYKCESYDYNESPNMPYINARNKRNRVTLEPYNDNY